MTKIDKLKIKEELERIRVLAKLYDDLEQKEYEDKEALETGIIRMKIAKEQILNSTKKISDHLQILEKE